MNSDEIALMHGSKVCAVVAALAIAGACVGPGGPTHPTSAGSPVLVGAGDIGLCGSEGSALTAALLDRIEGTVFAAGDLAYERGTRVEFAECYDPTWGRHRGRTRPAPGNHDYESPGAGPYFEYFGEKAGPPGLGYYSFRLGAWLILSLNSNVFAGEGSAQLAWVRQELAASPMKCTAAFWHHPLVSSGVVGNNAHMQAVWRALQAAGADVVIAAHAHSYERFGGLNADGIPAPDGIPQFVVGTGGGRLRPPFGAPKPGSEVRANGVYGVLKLTLYADAFDWEFVSAPSTPFHDAGRTSCR
jgi:hypothetical protein